MCSERLDLVDSIERLVEQPGEACVHLGVVVLGRDRDEQRLVAVATHKRLELVLRDASENGRVRDLVSVEVQDRQYRAVGSRVQELVGVPARCQRPSLCLPVPDDARDQ
jgi:hypothetical protein